MRTFHFPQTSCQQHPSAPYNPQTHQKRSRDDGDEAAAADLATADPAFRAPAAGSVLCPAPPLPFSFDILRRIVSRGAVDQTFYWRDDVVHVMRDAFPKATIHMLVLPRDTSIENLSVLGARIDAETSFCAEGVRRTRGHDATDGNHSEVPTATLGGPALGLLRHMIEVGDALIAHIKSMEPSLRHLTFQVGFHAVPSLKHLHMHVMSQDFERSPAMKHKKHYLSFTAPYFFLHATTVLRAIEAELQKNHSSTGPEPSKSTRLHRLIGTWTAAGTLIEQPNDIRCYWCNAQVKTMPALRLHLQSCPRNKCATPPPLSSDEKNAPP